MPTLSAHTVETAAQALLQARRLKRPLTTLPTECEPRSAADAYAIQDAVAAQLWPGAVTGWKTGAPSPEAEPIAAPIGRPLIWDSGVTLPAADFYKLGIEGELAYRLQHDLPPRSALYGRSEVEEAIASIHPLIEIVDTRIADWKSAGPWWKLADNQINGGLVVGVGVEDWRSVDPLGQQAVLRVNGEVLADTIGGNAAGDPLRLLVWLVNHCARRGVGLKAGDIVTTGTHTGLVFVEPGDTVSVLFPGVGEVHVSFSEAIPAPA